MKKEFVSIATNKENLKHVFFIHYSRNNTDEPLVHDHLFLREYTSRAVEKQQIKLYTTTVIRESLDPSLFLFYS